MMELGINAVGGREAIFGWNLNYNGRRVSVKKKSTFSVILDKILVSHRRGTPKRNIK